MGAGQDGARRSSGAPPPRCTDHATRPADTAAAGKRRREFSRETTEPPSRGQTPELLLLRRRHDRPTVAAECSECARICGRGTAMSPFLFPVGQSHRPGLKASLNCRFSINVAIRTQPPQAAHLHKQLAQSVSECTKQATFLVPPPSSQIPPTSVHNQPVRYAA